ncbi:unnamed protein product [Vicia faba]|uniref:Uncharacterized protein n=1 Tax=Vicia faba TaxID=3906 RepID=A0AAV0ZNK3_VICFA|nr:unnamed protein product [Vicia faba]
MDTSQLMYLFMSGRRVDIGQIIATKMKNVAENGNEFGDGTRTTHPLVYPDLIMGLLIASQKNKRRHREQTGQTSSNTLNYDDWDPRLRQYFTYTWDQNDSNHRAYLYLHDSFYWLHIQLGGKPDESHHFRTTE